MGLKDCISSALDRGAISKEEAEWLSRKADQYADLDGGQAKRLFGEELRAEDLQRMRVEQKQREKVDGLYSDFRRGARHTEKADISRFAAGMFENYGDGFASWKAKHDALVSQSISEINDNLHTFRRDLLNRRMNQPLMQDVVRGVFGENVSDAAKALGQSWSKVAEKLRAMFNEAGGHIAELKDWAFPQSHDPGALQRVGFEKWRDFIKPRLDWDRIKRPVTGLTVPEEQRDTLLRQIFNSIVTDGWNRHEPSQSPYGRGALYNRRDDARFLHFKDADSWLDYNREYGKGSPLASMIEHISGMTRDIALMDRFGPNPAATVEWMKQTVASEAAKYKLEEPSMFNGGSKLATDAKVKAAQTRIDGLFDAARGSGVPFSHLGIMGDILRNEQYGAKLGSAIATHIPGNSIIQLFGRRLQGHSMLQMPIDLLRSFSRNEADEAGLIMDDAMRHLESGAREQSAWLKARELSRWLPELTSQLSGLSAFARATERSAYLGQMSTYARVADREFGALPARVRDGLQGFGVDAGMWDRIRAAPLYGEDGGRKFLMPNNIADAEASLAYRAVLHGQNNLLVPKTNMQTQALVASTRHIPIPGAQIAMKSFLQFKGGFMATMWLTQMHAMEREWTRNGAAGAGAHAAAFVTALTLGGLITLQAKQAATGKDFLPMDPTSEQGRATWGRAFMSGGALGIYGDFLASEMSSYGHHLAETLVGPSITALDDFAHAVIHPNWGSLHKVLENNTPVASTLWAVRAAFNRVILDQISYMVDPKAHQKMREHENRIRRDTNQGMWWRPGELTPDRPPEFTTPAR